MMGDDDEWAGPWLGLCAVVWGVVILILIGV
jgi:hypothetical protein